MLIEPIAPEIVRYPYIPPHVWATSLGGKEIQKFRDAMIEQAVIQKIPLWIQKVLDEYTKQLIENYYALPEYDNEQYTHEAYRILIRTWTIQELIDNFVVDLDVRLCCEHIAEFYVQRFDKQFESPHEMSMIQKMNNLASIYHVWEIKICKPYLEKAVFDYLAGDHSSQAVLKRSLSTLFRLLLQKWQAMVRLHQQHPRIIPESLQKNDIGITYDASFIGLMSALMNKKNSQRLASIISPEGAHFDQYDNLHSKNILDAVQQLQADDEMLWCLLYIFHYHMRHDLVEMTKRYNTALHTRPSYV